MKIKTLEYIHHLLQTEHDRLEKASDERRARKRQAEDAYEAALATEDPEAISIAKTNLEDQKEFYSHAYRRAAEAENALLDFEAQEF